MYEYVVGLDIGSSKVCAAIGKINELGQFKITGISSVECKGLKKSVVVDIEKTSTAIKQCIGQLEKMVDIEIKSVNTSIIGGMCEIAKNKGVVAISSRNREISESDVARALESSKLISIPSDKEIIDAMPMQFIVDGYDGIKDPLGMCGSKLEADAQIVIAPSDLINNLRKSINGAGLRVDSISIHPLVVSNVVLREEEIKNGVAIVDIGAESIDISIYKKENLCYTSMVPLGGNNISNDIALCLNMPYLEAEKLKFKYGSVIKEPDEYNEVLKIKSSNNEEIEVRQNMLTEIIEARVEELLGFIKLHIQESGYYEEINNVVIVGGGVSLFKGINHLSENILGKPVRIGSPEYIGAASPLYAAAVGVVKNVFNSIKRVESNDEVEVSSRNRKKDNKDVQDREQEKNGLASKIKEFFADLF